MRYNFILRTGCHHPDSGADYSHTENISETSAAREEDQKRSGCRQRTDVPPFFWSRFFSETDKDESGASWWNQKLKWSLYKLSTYVLSPWQVMVGRQFICLTRQSRPSPTSSSVCNWCYLIKYCAHCWNAGWWVNLEIRPRISSLEFMVA